MEEEGKKMEGGIEDFYCLVWEKRESKERGEGILFFWAHICSSSQMWKENKKRMKEDKWRWLVKVELDLMICARPLFLALFSGLHYIDILKRQKYHVVSVKLLVTYLGMIMCSRCLLYYKYYIVVPWKRENIPSLVLL